MHSEHSKAKKSSEFLKLNSILLFLLFILIGMAFQHFFVESQLSSSSVLKIKVNELDEKNAVLTSKLDACVDEKNFVNEELSSCLKK